ncbi:MAG: DMT family transporter [Pseudomonadota bacterium]|nr:DMT family transporter [Pseudomonadota bacterium]
MTERSERLRGVLMMLAAVGAFSIMDAMMKSLTLRYPAVQIAFLRGASSLPFVFLTYALAGRLSALRPVRFGLHVVRAAFAVLMLWGFLWALARASLADTYAVYMCAPLLVVLAGSLMLGERIARHVWFAIFTGLAGVFVMLRPSVEGFASLAGLAALGSALAYAIVVVMVRILARTETTAAMVFWYLVLLAAGALIIALPGWVAIVAADWPWIVGIGLAGWAGQYLITEAFRLAPASVVAPFEYSALVWGVAIDWVVWQALPGVRMLVGSAIVVGAGLYLLYREQQSSLP